MVVCHEYVKSGDVFPPCPRNVPPQIYDVVCRAVAKQCRMEIGYVDNFGIRTRRAVRAESLGRCGRKWYCQAFCETRQDRRSFALDGIVSARLLKRGEVPVFSGKSGDYFGVYVEWQIHYRLKHKLDSLTEEKKTELFALYMAKYVKRPRKYFSREFDEFLEYDCFCTAQKRDRILQLVPALLPLEERCKLLKRIIDENEYRCRNFPVLRRYEYSQEEWPVKRREFEEEIRRSAQVYADNLDYSVKYDLPQLSWTEDPGVTAYRQKLENLQKLPLKHHLADLPQELDNFDKSCRQLELPSPATKETELSFRFSLPEETFLVIVYNRAYRERQKQLNKFLLILLCSWLILAMLAFLFAVVMGIILE